MQLAEAYSNMQETGAEFLAIGRFSAESGKQTRDTLRLPFPILSDPDGNVVDRYSGTLTGSMVMARTGTYVVDQNGIVVFERVEGGSVEPTSPDEILTALDQL